MVVVAECVTLKLFDLQRHCFCVLRVGGGRHLIAVFSCTSERYNASVFSFVL